MDPSHTNPFAGIDVSPQSVEARIDDARRDAAPRRVGLDLAALFALLSVLAVVIGVSLRLLGLA